MLKTILQMAGVVWLVALLLLLSTAGEYADDPRPTPNAVQLEENRVAAELYQERLETYRPVVGWLFAGLMIALTVGAIVVADNRRK